MLFHDGTTVTATAVAEILTGQLPSFLGAAYTRVKEIRVHDKYELELVLKERSNFVLEGLDILIQAGGELPIGTGPFRADRDVDGQAHMLANEEYHGGAPLIERVVITPYSSVRSAWAEMLRGKVDMLYDVGVDAVDFLQPSSDVNVFEFPRPYASVVTLNTQRPQFRSAAARRGLNAAIDRHAVVLGALGGRGTPAASPIWPYHWAYDNTLLKFEYRPYEFAVGRQPIEFTLLYTEPSQERLALLVQKQLFEAGARVALETVPLDLALARLRAGDFDAFLGDVGLGPMMVRPYLFWYSGNPLNFGRYSSPRTDAALEALEAAATDSGYRTAMSELHRALIDDPPSIFLSWSHRIRAVSSGFDVIAEPNRDIVPTLRLWRLTADTKTAVPN